MKWIKRGRIYCPDGSRWWARRNASFPTAQLREDAIRVYFAGLDEDNMGRTGFVDLALDDPGRVVNESPEPVLDIGEIGTFDDCGANAFSVVRHDGATYLYYQGWQRTERIPYLIFTGLAVDKGDGNGFQKRSPTPILDRVEGDAFLRGAPYVMKVAGEFRMWYVSCRRWIHDDHGLHYDVGVRHARSEDGIAWLADPQPCVVPEPPDEYAVGRPSVLVDHEGLYRMWYSVRSFSQPYRLGYAESRDGRHWARKDDEVGITRSPEGWDSEMICYPQVVETGGRLLMFYNGNRHGQSGFGYAEAVL